MAMHFEDLLLGCSVTLSKACNGKAWLNIKSLGGKALDLEHSIPLFLMPFCYFRADPFSFWHVFAHLLYLSHSPSFDIREWG